MKHPLIALTALAFSLMSPSFALEYEIDASHSATIFGIQHIGLGKTYGRFNDFKGTIHFDAADLSTSSLSVTIQVASVDTYNEKRDKHLRNADFFDAGTYPTMTFNGKGFTPVEGKKDTYKIKGMFTLLNQSKEIEVEIVKTGEVEHFFAKKPALGFESMFSISQKDFSFGNGKAAAALGDVVSIIVSLEAIAK